MEKWKRSHERIFSCYLCSRGRLWETKYSPPFSGEELNLMSYGGVSNIIDICARLQINDMQCTCCRLWRWDWNNTVIDLLCIEFCISLFDMKTHVSQYKDRYSCWLYTYSVGLHYMFLPKIYGSLRPRVAQKSDFTVLST